MSNAIEWLEQCGWAGWLEDQLTGEIVVDNGDTFRDVGALKSHPNYTAARSQR
jgi:hypothetical protein